ncbi:MAG: Ig-like domain-containing protein [Gemmatimonadota bacterium]|nr:Ig-like domain-containing protein [Gemmatimonadota bacterium]
MRHRLGLNLALATVFTACGGGSEPAGPPAALVAINPGPFTGPVGELLAEPLSVRVTDAAGRGVPGAVVRFTVTAGNGYVTAGGLGGSVLDDSTDQGGVAMVTWGLGTVAGAHTVSAGFAGLTPIEFSATATAGAPAVAVVIDASAFIAPVSSPTDEPLAVRVEDLFGNPVAGALVNWAALGAGATVATASTSSDADGIAEVGATLGATPGLYLFRASPVGGTPDTIGVLAVTIVADPQGDQTPTGDPAFDAHDATRFGALVIQDALVLYAKFAGTIGPGPAGQPNRAALLASYDLDLDGDSLTGFFTFRQCLGGAPLGIGVDAFVDLDQNSGFLTGVANVPPDAVAVLRVDSLFDADRCNSSFSGAVYPAVAAYQPTSVSLAIPLAFLQDDGGFAVSTLFAHPGTGTVTDIVPDSVAWQFIPTLVPGPATTAAVTSVWEHLALPRPSGRAIPVERMPMLRRFPVR